jgi:hypothetical protein
MNNIRAALLGILAVSMATAALAQPLPGATAMADTQFVTVAPRLGTPRYPTPLFTIGGVAVGIWTPVPPPYDGAANRSAAANPVP